MELNSGLQWGDVPTYVKKTFKGGSAKHVHLPVGFRLFVLSQYSSLKMKDEKFSSFFSPRRPFKGDPGLHKRIREAKSSSYNIIDYMRECSAYAEQRGGTRYAIELKLKEPVWGYFGVIRRQGGKVKSGGAVKGYHFYIPGLQTPSQIVRQRAHDLIVK